MKNWSFLFIAAAHNRERATPILGLCYGVFTDQFIFRHILGHFFPRKYNLHHVYERIRSIRYQKGKLNVIKRQNIFLGLWVLLTGLWNLKDIQIRAKTILNMNWSLKRRDTSAWKLLAPGYRSLFIFTL